jgi:hypothetical protein
MPTNFREVTRDQFFKALAHEEAKGSDIMPRIIGSHDKDKGYLQEWANARTRAVFGKTYGGNGCGENKQWFLLDRHLATIT